MITLTEAGKAHVIHSLDIKFEPNEFVTAEEMPEHKRRVYQAWFNHCESKLNRVKTNTIQIGLGWLKFEERMLHYAK